MKNSKSGHIPPEELVLHVAEDLPHGAVVDAVTLPGHALLNSQ